MRTATACATLLRCKKVFLFIEMLDWTCARTSCYPMQGQRLARVPEAIERSSDLSGMLYDRLSNGRALRIAT